MTMLCNSERENEIMSRNCWCNKGQFINIDLFENQMRKEK